MDYLYNFQDSLLSTIALSAHGPPRRNPFDRLSRRCHCHPAAHRRTAILAVDAWRLSRPSDVEWALDERPACSKAVSPRIMRIRLPPISRTPSSGNFDFGVSKPTQRCSSFVGAFHVTSRNAHSLTADRKSVV